MLEKFFKNEKYLSSNKCTWLKKRNQKKPSCMVYLLKNLGQIFLEEDRIWSEFCGFHSCDSLLLVFPTNWYLKNWSNLRFFYFSGKTLYLFYQEAHGFALSNFLILAPLIPKCLYPLIHWQMDSLIHWQMDIFWFHHFLFVSWNAHTVRNFLLSTV